MQLSALADNLDALSLSLRSVNQPPLQLVLALARAHMAAGLESSTWHVSQPFEVCEVNNGELFWIVFHISAGHAVLLVLAHVRGSTLGEEMGGPAPYSPAPLTPVAVRPRIWRLQVSWGNASLSKQSSTRCMFQHCRLWWSVSVIYCLTIGALFECWDHLVPGLQLPAFNNSLSSSFFMNNLWLIKCRIMWTKPAKV